MKIKKEILKQLTWYSKCENFESIQRKQVGRTRWVVEYEQVIKDINTGKYYKSYYQDGATECQDQSPYDYADDEVEVTEVFPIEKTITVYE